MSFQYSERHREEYFRDGYTVLPGLIPPALLADLRRESEHARELARGLHGPQAQRLQPVTAHPGLNLRPFAAFLELEGLQATAAGILGQAHTPSGEMAILFEPADRPWSTAWHRDWGYNMPGVDLDEFFTAAADRLRFNQLNAPLYDDGSLWFVPGSDVRRDTDEERAAFPSIPPPGPDLDDGMGDAEVERRCVDYARSMPGAANLFLAAGDCAFYRSCAWHLGRYVTPVRRATLHDGFLSPADRDFATKERARMEAAPAR